MAGVCHRITHCDVTVARLSQVLVGRSGMSFCVVLSSAEDEAHLRAGLDAGDVGTGLRGAQALAWPSPVAQGHQAGQHLAEVWLFGNAGDAFRLGLEYRAAAGRQAGPEFLAAMQLQSSSQYCLCDDIRR